MSSESTGQKHFEAACSKAAAAGCFGQDVALSFYYGSIFWQSVVYRLYILAIHLSCVFEVEGSVLHIIPCYISWEYSSLPQINTQ